MAKITINEKATKEVLLSIGFKPIGKSSMYIVSEVKDGVTMGVLINMISKEVKLSADNSLVKLPKCQIEKEITLESHRSFSPNITRSVIIDNAMSADEVRETMCFDLDFNIPHIFMSLLLGCYINCDFTG